MMMRVPNEAVAFDSRCLGYWTPQEMTSLQHLMSAGVLAHIIILITKRIAIITRKECLISHHFPTILPCCEQQVLICSSSHFQPPSHYYLENCHNYKRGVFDFPPLSHHLSSHPHWFEDQIIVIELLFLSAQ